MKKVFSKADKADGKKDGKVKFESMLDSFTKYLEDVESEEADQSEEPENEVSEQEDEVAEDDDDSNPLCFIDPVFAKNEVK